MEPIKLNLGCGRDIRDGFVNVDWHKHEGVDRQVDLFKYPWTELDQYVGKVEHIVANHIIEHIPHTARLNQYLFNADKLPPYVDGFFHFFYECWKLLIQVVL